ncbi:MAG: aspartate/glutamate racemase family protein [Gammaproteobacteria bacterium]|jgi:aspartate racemase|nr:aspartate/glutamate racemase family protein [Gammaproteobacteria bacterium]MEC9222323.1 aspartate/glutamate racemase family protein [Pseudomonadota bacterium]MEE2607947.1 aspartate/glutamate racemase family protein [Pseudomonadota bacterium]MEE3172794.1 aspartate/glutamate racemase family protein [Pseudomonadota bacterium]|tara:strand:- start:367 stop:1062 length:696 start_codon:yes stop_codon:yes gene_type:complete
MKTIGMLGGMSWESTATYYREINEGIKQNLGGLHSAKICLYSVDFDEIEKLQHTDDWDTAAMVLADGARKIEAGGADFLIICTNTMHRVASEIEQAISIPLLHIADATALKLKDDNITRVGLLGTRFTMEHNFYKSRITELFGIEVLVPEPDERTLLHAIIYDELCLGKIENTSRQQCLEIISRLFARGAQAVILGCTEIALLISQDHTNIPLYDTTVIHANQAVSYALKD